MCVRIIYDSRTMTTTIHRRRKFIDDENSSTVTIHRKDNLSMSKFVDNDNSEKQYFVGLVTRDKIIAYISIIIILLTFLEWPFFEVVHLGKAECFLRRNGILVIQRITLSELDSHKIRLPGRYHIWFQIFTSYPILSRKLSHFKNIFSQKYNFRLPIATILAP